MEEKLSIAIPSSSLLNENDEKLKAYKVGIIARAAAIFRVDEILIYRDPLLDESDFMVEILCYLETPQYLRKQLFPIKENLRYVGVIPPLAIPSHKSKHLKIGELREGIVKKVAPDGTRWVDVGIDTLAPLQSNDPQGARVTVRITSKEPLRVEKAKPQEYWGYKVRKVGLEDVLEKENAVVTSKMGKVPSLRELRRDATLIFGNPKEEVFEIMSRMGLKKEIKKIWNTVPMQGVRSVRLEEAIFATLALINFASFKRC